MSVTLKANLNLVSNWNYQSVDPIGNPADQQSVELKLTQGTGLANLATKMYRAQRTVVSGTPTDDIDLYGGLLDVFGNTLNFATIREIVIINLSAVAGDNLLVGGAVTNPWTPPFNGSATAKSKIPAGGMWVIADPLQGMAVVNASSDILRVAWNGVSHSITYDLILKGT